MAKFFKEYREAIAIASNLDNDYTTTDIKGITKAIGTFCRSIAKKNGWMFSFHKRYNSCSGFFSDSSSKYTYVSFSDYRFQQGRVEKILYRTAKSDKDFVGGHNCFCEIEELEERLKETFRR